MLECERRFEFELGSAWELSPPVFAAKYPFWAVFGLRTHPRLGADGGVKVA